MIKTLNFILIIIFIAVLIIFSSYNSKEVSIRFLNLQSIKIPISIVVFSAVIIGILIGLIYHFYVLYRSKKGHKGEGEGEIQNK